jgi:hypothetical protein
MADMAPRDGETVVSEPASERALVWVGFPVLGAVVGWLLKLISTWVAGLAWAPFQGPFKLVASIDEPYATVGSLAVGLAAGLAVAFIAAWERLTVTVSYDAATFMRGSGVTVRVDRPAVDAVFMDGKHLVLLGSSGQELARNGCDLTAEALRTAFVKHGYPWRADGDPYREEFRLWVEDLPGLPEGANALFKARAKALAKRNEDDARALRNELLRLGIVVREEKRRQYWRPATWPHGINRE